jgi:hypothetical protein
MQNKKTLIIWGIFFIILVFAALNRHSRSKPFHYSSQIMSDKAGYYVYLPALFLYEFNSSKFPSKVDSLTGNGFYLDPNNNKIQSKYPVGVAVLLSPFFMVAHSYAIVSNNKTDGFSMPYQNAIDFASVFYVLLGLYFLNQFLLNFSNQRLVTFSLISLFLGSNLYYYTIFEGGYSHVYTFFLFSCWLFLLKKFEKSKDLKYWFLIIAFASLIILVRQINVIFILLSIGLFSSTKDLFTHKRVKDWLIGIGVFLCILSPQIIYNLYLTQTPFTYSYQNEGFIYWLNPKWIEVMFGFENGWITTNPIIILSIVGLYFLYKNDKKLGILTLLILVSCIYIYASWWAYKLGCSFGHRGFVDIYPFLSIPFTIAISTFLANKKQLIRSATIIFLAAGIIFNLKYVYTYDSCWPAVTEQSDFEIFWHFITSAPK